MTSLDFASASEGMAGIETAISQAYFPYEIYEVGRNDCVFAFSSTSIGPLAMMRTYLNTPLRGRRRSQRAPNNSHHYILQLVEDVGRMTISQGGRCALADTYDMVLTHAGRPLEVEQHESDFRTLAVRVPARLLEAHFTNVDQWCLAPRSSEHGSATLLREFLLTAWRERNYISEVEANDLVEALLHLIGASFRGCSALPDFDSRSAKMHFLKIRDLVAANLTNPALSADFVTAKLGISRSYLFTIMRAADTTLGRYIIDARLERARELLATGSAKHQSITDLAFSVGFQELSHFSRRFTQRFGKSPRAFRAELLGEEGA